jgi:hypothetical protein
VTGLLTTCGCQQADWTAAYRLFSRHRLDARRLLDGVRRGVVGHLEEGEPLVVALDDTLLPKKGTKIHGVSWRRDPLGPPFRTNFVRAQRVLQLSAALPVGDGPVRTLPIDFVHAPSPGKPRRDATPEQWHAYRQAATDTRLGVVAAGRLVRLRGAMDADPASSDRELLVVADGGYTNGTVLKDLPQRTVFVGRVRADAKLYRLPEQTSGRGRRRIYGEAAPTPDQLRRDDAVLWQTVRVWAAGAWHDMRVKTVSPLRWRATAGRHDLRLVVIAPLHYRPRKGSPLLYRKPAYLICTDPALPVQRLVQSYVWRWDIEVNFRDEKTLFGVGQAQVRTATSVETVPRLLVAAYAALLLAAHQTSPRQGALPAPRWRRHLPRPRTSTQDLVHRLRTELWGKALGIENCPHFPTPESPDTKSEKIRPHLPSAVLYACG